jgi:hypothetical protein
VIYSLEDKSQKELVEIVGIQIEEYQLLTKQNLELTKMVDHLLVRNKHLSERK